MKRRGTFCQRLPVRIIAFSLALCLTLPNPSLALRNEQPVNNTGLEERVAQALGHPAAPRAYDPNGSEEHLKAGSKEQREKEQEEEDRARPNRLVFGILPKGGKVEMSLPGGEQVQFRVLNGQVEIAPGGNSAREFLTHRRRSLQPGGVFSFTLYKTGLVLPKIQAGNSIRWRPVEEKIYLFPLKLIDELLKSQTNLITSPLQWRVRAPYVFSNLGREADGTFKVELRYWDKPVSATQPAEVQREMPAAIPVFRILDQEPAISAAGLEEWQEMQAALAERLDGWRSAAERLKVVVIGPSVAERFSGLHELTRLNQHFLVDRGNDTVVQLIGLTGLEEIGSVSYYGGLEEAQRFSALTTAAQFPEDFVRHHPPTQGFFLAQLQEILTLAGIPQEVVAAGLEEFAAGLEELASGA